VRHPANRRLGSIAHLGLSLLLAASACASLRHSDTPEDDTDVVTVMIINHHQLNVTVFNVASGRRDRIGEVTAAASSSFKIHIRRLPNSEMQLLADPIGSSRTTRTELLRVGAGDTVSWVLETDLARSHVEIH
jgi:hypothetical protein